MLIQTIESAAGDVYVAAAADLLDGTTVVGGEFRDEDVNPEYIRGVVELTTALLRELNPANGDKESVEQLLVSLVASSNAERHRAEVATAVHDHDQQQLEADRLHASLTAQQDRR